MRRDQQFWSGAPERTFNEIVAEITEPLNRIPSAHRLADFASLAMNIGPISGNAH